MSAISGRTPSESLAKWDPKSCCWRTYQASLWSQDTLEPLSGSFLSSGMTVGGVLYRQQPLVLRTSVGGGGVWVGTPTQLDALGTIGRSEAFNSKTPTPTEMAMTGMWPTPKGSAEHYGQPRENDRGDLQAAVLWPTPQAHDSGAGDASRVGRFGTEHGGRNLNDEVQMWRTPDSYDRGGAQDPEKRKEGGHSVNLQDQVHQWPTPTSNLGRNETSSRQADTQHHSGTTLHDVAYKEGGQLNPAWVCWLMGVPIGWVSLEPLESAEILGWETEPDIPRVATGVKDRVSQLKALGNGIVPACVAEFLERLNSDEGMS